MTEFRCRKCARLMFRGDFVGTVEIKCPRCDEVNTVTEHVLPTDYADEPLEGLIERLDRQTY